MSSARRSQRSAHRHRAPRQPRQRKDPWLATLERAQRDRGLRPAAKALLAVIHQLHRDAPVLPQILIGFGDPSPRSGTRSPAAGPQRPPGLAEAAGMSRRSMIRSRWDLELRGYLRVKPGGGLGPSRYCGGDRRIRAAGAGVWKAIGRGGRAPGGLGRANGYYPAVMPDPDPRPSSTPPAPAPSRPPLSSHLGPDPRSEPAGRDP